MGDGWTDFSCIDKKAPHRFSDSITDIRSTAMNLFHLLFIFSSLPSLYASHVNFDLTNDRFLNNNGHVVHSAVHRMEIEETDLEYLELQRAWWEWNFCTNAQPSENFTEMTDTVPNNTVFLARHKNGLKSDNVTCNDPITRVGTISTGMQRIMIPVWTAVAVDFTDDYMYGICTNSSAESEMNRFLNADESATDKKDPDNAQYILFKVDNVTQEPFFLYDNRTYFLFGCNDGRTTEEYETLDGQKGDLCDGNELFEPFNGLDAYPMFGWWGVYDHNWSHNERHTFEFGITNDDCQSVKYNLTAKDPSITSEGSAAVGRGGTVVLGLLVAVGYVVFQLW